MSHKEGEYAKTGTVPGSVNWVVDGAGNERPRTGPGGLTGTMTPPPLPAAINHQWTDNGGKGRTSSHLSKCSVTLLLPAAFTPPDTKFKVISSQCVHECVWGIGRVN